LLLAGKVPLRYNLRNLRVRWKTTLLTALAFTVVVALLMVMHAFATGIQRLSQGSGQPANVMVLSDGASDELYSNLPMSETSELGRQDGVQRDAAGRPLCSREVYILINQPVSGPHTRTSTAAGAEGGVRVDQRSKHRFVPIRGIEEPEVSARVHGLELSAGTWFSPAGVRNLAPGDQVAAGTASAYAYVEAVLGEGVARDFGRDRNKESLEVGDVFPLGPRQSIVVGILRGAETTFGSEVWAKRQKVGEIFGKENLYTSIVLRTEGPARAKQLAEWLSRDFKKVAVSAMTEPEYFAKMSEANQQLLGSIYFVAGIMALGGIFGVMNTMFAAIRQRTTDIGVLRILGFARWQVLVSFLMEALVIAALGGGLGGALGWLMNGVNTNSVVGTSGGGVKRLSFQMVVDGNTLAAAVLFTLVMGLLGGLLPAVSAMSRKPLESLQ
jgi:cell division protein FtsX